MFSHNLTYRHTPDTLRILQAMEQKPPNSEGHKMPSKRVLAGLACLLLAGAGTFVWLSSNAHETNRSQLAHDTIATTVFWVGEEADASNGFIHNKSSTWTEDWVGAYGGVDDPNNRCNLLPCDFTPKENPFYFALPYSDLQESCDAKPSQREVPWYTQPPPEGESIIKNQWIKVRFAGKVAYAQWADAGPFGEDDTNYVFGSAAPQAQAGLDISPATAEYIGLEGRGNTEWEFVSEQDVPAGPWRQTITTSQPDCAN